MRGIVYETLESETMNSNRALAVLGVWAFIACPAAWAQQQAQQQTAPKPTPVVMPATEVRDPAEPNVKHTVIEDDATRIEELKVRGQTQRMTVTPKGLKSYEILPATQGRDMSDSAGSQRGAAGKRVWQIITF